MEVEVVDDEEFAMLEAICLQAEQNSNQSSNEIKPNKPRFIPACLANLPPAPPLPFLIYRGQTTYCREVAQIDRAAAFLLAIGSTVGFDVEWTVTYETGKPPRPIALIQLCVVDPSVYSPDGRRSYHCFLLHINRRIKTENSNKGGGGTELGLSPKLIELLTSEAVLKAGIGIHGDLLKVERDYGIKMKGVIDLSEAANARLCSPPSTSTAAETVESAAPPPLLQMPQKWSMAALAEKLMKATVNKSQSIRCSDWEQDPLTAEQQKYAATDAWVSLRLHEILSLMPITWQPAAIPNPIVVGKIGRTKEDADVDNISSGGIIVDKDGYIPGCREPAALQPAKLAVLQQYYQGIDVIEIATLRQIQPSTVQSYLAEAIIAGYAYNWDRLGVANEIVSLAAQIAREAGVVPLPLLESSVEQSTNALSVVKERVEYTPRDVLNELLAARNIKIRALFEEMESKISGLGFGDLRLAFAHLGRKGCFV